MSWSLLKYPATSAFALLLGAATPVPPAPSLPPGVKTGPQLPDTPGDTMIGPHWIRFVDSVMACWNVEALSTEAAQIVLRLGVELEESGLPVASSIRLMDAPPDSAPVRETFESARRAILECGERGFDLPQGNHDQWRWVEIEFNPEIMRTR
ncbi:hypothetical protein R3X27_21085 [Tropicimonas sp. TH_r6]|uniref:hypothetical protein n=1 Tax=Tropicimonas sp. TH_r6 TaxID=3082085 RepID=UPI0029532133|nr:hypothetical protein [Tropicimonas sp. TH_r6]MDV7145185.1 hypothetical protein [Tropicimonas sp. TH_r6]